MSVNEAICLSGEKMEILIGADDSKLSVHVAGAVIAHFRAENTEILVLNVLQPVALSEPPEMAAGCAPEMESQKKPAHELVGRVATLLRSSGFKADTAVEAGDVREGIIDAAAAWHADLIIVGSHGQSGLRRFLLGSVAEFVARHATCSVEIVRSPVSI
jgi:nucleotide-binding universal stress UspA family protein